MNYKNVFVVLAALLIVGFMMQPVAAVWQSGNWITDEKNVEYEKVYTMSYDSVSDVTSKIRETPGNEDPFQYSGFVVVSVATRHNLIGKEFVMQRIDPTGINFVSNTRVSKEFVEMFPKTGGNLTMELRPDGIWEDFFAEGVYSFSLLDGNGGQPEYVIASVTPGYRTNVNFLGHGVSMASEPEKVIDTTEDLPEDVCKNVMVVSLLGHHGDHLDISFDNPNNGKCKVTVTVTETYRYRGWYGWVTKTETDSRVYIVNSGHSHEEYDLHSNNIGYSVDKWVTLCLIEEHHCDNNCHHH